MWIHACLLLFRQAEIDALRSVDWDEELAAARDPTVAVRAV